MQYLNQDGLLNLKKRLENAHKHVREHTCTEMLRQKKYHIKRLDWESFKIGYLVFVYFARHKNGLSSKLTINWHRPFKVLAKLSGVNYMVNCGPRNTPQLILLDRWGRFDLKYLQVKTKIKEVLKQARKTVIKQK